MWLILYFISQVSIHLSLILISAWLFFNIYFISQASIHSHESYKLSVTFCSMYFNLQVSIHPQVSIVLSLAKFSVTFYPTCISSEVSLYLRPSSEFLERSGGTECWLGCTWGGLTWPSWCGRRPFTCGRWWWPTHPRHWGRSCPPSSHSSLVTSPLPAMTRDRYAHVLSPAVVSIYFVA